MGMAKQNKRKEGMKEFEIGRVSTREVRSMLMDTLKEDKRKYTNTESFTLLVEMVKEFLQDWEKFNNSK